MKNILEKSLIITLFMGLITMIYSCTKAKDSTLPVLTTANVSEITHDGAVSGGNITDDGGAQVTVRGVCWATTSNPVATGLHTTDGTGTGTFASSITGLATNTLYYVRAYATNSVGTAYGMEVSFTSSTSSFASLTTTAASSVTATTASSGGDITDDNGSDITERGVCWSINTNPTIADLHTSDGPGKGVFTSNLTGLTSGTKYYVKAYATNSAGTSYGNEVSFTTTSAPGINEVWIQGSAFTPATITVSAGTTIKWTNKDVAAHTVTNDSGEAEIFDSGSMANGATFSRQFNNTGSFKYHCTFHAGMKATVVVQ